MNRLRQMKSRMSSGLGNIIKLKELQEVSAKYIILVNKYKKLNSIKEKLQIEQNIPLECIINIKNLGHAYNELVNDREEHLNEFFDVFTDSTKRRTVGGLLLHDNVVLTGICIANITAAAMSVISNNYTNLSIPSSIILTSVNTISLTNKYKLYKNNYIKANKIINSDNDTKEEYKEYCLRRNIKNKSI
ncbi:MAG: hypothetical protein Q4E69_03415 [Bacilli bacterium]|nr:hypothetical protein [Bacilli bacterium]